MSEFKQQLWSINMIPNDILFEKNKRLEQTLKEIKEIAEEQQSWNEWNRQFSQTESEDDIFAYNRSALNKIILKISEVEDDKAD